MCNNNNNSNNDIICKQKLLEKCMQHAFHKLPQIQGENI